MRMIDIIEKKKNKGALTRKEIRFWIEGMTKGEIPDYQTSALAMAVVLNGMKKEEAYYLTGAMRDSGDRLSLAKIKGIKVDKHSTGGVGDKTSLILLPIVASCGAKVAKMSGRGLGHTGGTLDKLESIPGLSVSMDEDRFIKQVNDIGIAIIGQTASLAPADKILYALRDVTSTVDSIPLIASSVMSKKLASGADTILLDVTVGKGAFMKNIKSATELANLMINIGRYHHKEVAVVLSNMNEPLGSAVGNSLEIKEVIDCLKGNWKKDIKELIYQCASIMLEQAKIVKNMKEAYPLIDRVIDNGEAFNKFKEMVASQGGDTSYLDDPSKFLEAKYRIDLLARNEGYIKDIDALVIGKASMRLGAGRETKLDNIDMSAGIYLHKKCGDYVIKGEPLLTLYTSKEDIEEIKEYIYSAYKVSSKPQCVKPIIMKVMKA